MAGRQRWQDYANLVAGLWLLIAPWVLGTAADPTSSSNAWTLGLIIAVVAAWALLSPKPVATEWINAILGAWTFIAPWVLGFKDLAAAWNAWTIGFIVLVLAVWALGKTGSSGAPAQGG